MIQSADSFLISDFAYRLGLWSWTRHRADGRTEYLVFAKPALTVIVEETFAEFILTFVDTPAGFLDYDTEKLAAAVNLLRLENDWPQVVIKKPKHLLTPPAPS